MIYAIAHANKYDAPAKALLGETTNYKGSLSSSVLGGGQRSPTLLGGCTLENVDILSYFFFATLGHLFANK